MLRIFVKWCVKIFTLILFRVKTYGKENIEEGKPYIMCANHISNWDALTIYTATKREMYVMAKEEMFVNKFVHWFANKMNVFPVKRGKKDIESIKKSLISHPKHSANLGKNKTDGNASPFSHLDIDCGEIFK